MKKTIIIMALVCLVATAFAAEQKTWPSQADNATWPQASEGNTWPAETWPSETDSQTWPAETWPENAEATAQFPTTEDAVSNPRITSTGKVVVDFTKEAKKVSRAPLKLFGKEWFFSHTDSSLLFRKRYNFTLNDNKENMLFIAFPNSGQEKNIQPLCQEWEDCQKKKCAKSKNTVWQMYTKQRSKLTLKQTAKGPKVVKKEKNNLVGVMFVDQEGNSIYAEITSSKDPNIDKQVLSQSLCQEAPEIISYVINTHGKN